MVKIEGEEKESGVCGERRNRGKSKKKKKKMDKVIEEKTRNSERMKEEMRTEKPGKIHKATKCSALIIRDSGMV